MHFRHRFSQIFADKRKNAFEVNLEHAIKEDFPSVFVCVHLRQSFIL